jgi:hypothetical protein
MPYDEAGYRIIRVDPKFERIGGCDAYTLHSRHYCVSLTVEKFLKAARTPCFTDALMLNPGDVHGILMAPPCTDFSVSGAQYWPAKDDDGRTKASMAIVESCLAIVRYFKPVWWVLENPVGRLPELFPRALGNPRMYFDPWEYAGWWDKPDEEAYTKKTGLWGTFNHRLERRPVPPVRVCSQGSWVQKLGGKSERTKELRSLTPIGFARAFYAANR